MYPIKTINEIKVGDRATISKTVTEADGALYIASTGDFGPVHIDDGYAATSPVDAYPAGQSPYGIFDLAGNLTEWVFDFYAPYPEGLVVDPLGPSVGEDRCMRCGIWVGDAGLTRESIDEKHNLRAESRSRDDPRSSDDHLGIRVTAALR